MKSPTFFGSIFEDTIWVIYLESKSYLKNCDKFYGTAENVLINISEVSELTLGGLGAGIRDC